MSHRPVPRPVQVVGLDAHEVHVAVDTRPQQAILLPTSTPSQNESCFFDLYRCGISLRKYGTSLRQFHSKYKINPIATFVELLAVIDRNVVLLDFYIDSYCS